MKWEIMPESVIWTFVGILFSGLLGSILTRQHKARERHISASDTFRNAILGELKGLYPPSKCFTNDDFTRIKNSIPTIRTLCHGYREHVACCRRKSFDQAIEQYCRDCDDLPKMHSAEYAAKAVMADTNLKDPQEVFKHNVDLMLSFAKPNQQFKNRF